MNKMVPIIAKKYYKQMLMNTCREKKNSFKKVVTKEREYHNKKIE